MGEAAAADRCPRLDCRNSTGSPRPQLDLFLQTLSRRISLVLGGSAAGYACYGCRPADGPPAFRVRPPPAVSGIGASPRSGSVADCFVRVSLLDSLFGGREEGVNPANSWSILGRHAP